MMTQQTTKATALVRLLVLLPLLAMTTLCFSFKTKAEAIIGNNTNEHHFYHRKLYFPRE